MKWLFNLSEFAAYKYICFFVSPNEKNDLLNIDINENEMKSEKF